MIRRWCRRKELHKMNVRFTLAYNAVIGFSWKGQRVSVRIIAKPWKLLMSIQL